MVFDFIFGSRANVLSDGLPISQTLERNALEQQEFPCGEAVRIEKMYVKMTRVTYSSAPQSSVRMGYE